MAKAPLKWERNSGELQAFTSVERVSTGGYGRKSVAMTVYPLFARIRWQHDAGLVVNTNDWAATFIPVPDEAAGVRVIEAMYALED